MYHIVDCNRLVHKLWALPSATCRWCFLWSSYYTICKPTREPYQDVFICTICRAIISFIGALFWTWPHFRLQTTRYSVECFSRWKHLLNQLKWLTNCCYLTMCTSLINHATVDLVGILSYKEGNLITLTNMCCIWCHCIVLYCYPQPCIAQKIGFLFYLYLWYHVHLPQDLIHLICTTLSPQLAHQQYLLQLVGILHHVSWNVCTL